tara:strand:+ start:3931 stop:4863 length:933 start_codon:yes stop_codon:yes gene_type:complete
MPTTPVTTASGLAPSQLSTLQGELEAGRNPQWVLQSKSEQLLAPVESDDGISLTNGSDGAAIQAPLRIGVRRVAAYRTVIVQIASVANTTQYDIVIATKSGAHTATMTSDGSATAQEIADGLKLSIDGSGTIGPDLTTFVEQDPGTGDYRLRIIGKQSSDDQGTSDFTITSWAVGASANGAELGVKGDPTYVEAIIWGLGGGAEGPGQTVGIHQRIAFVGGTGGSEELSGWSRVTSVLKPGSVPVVDIDGLIYVPFGGLLDRLDVRGLQRIHVQLVHIEGPAGDNAAVTLQEPWVLIGPAQRESTRAYGI